MAQFNSMVEAHVAMQPDTSSSTQSDSNPFSLDGFPEGNAADLIDVARAAGQYKERVSGV